MEHTEQIKTFLAPDKKAVDDLVYLSQRASVVAQTLAEASTKLLELANSYQRQTAELEAMYLKYEGSPDA